MPGSASAASLVAIDEDPEGLRTGSRRHSAAHSRTASQHRRPVGGHTENSSRDTFDGLLFAVRRRSSAPDGADHDGDHDTDRYVVSEDETSPLLAHPHLLPQIPRRGYSSGVDVHVSPHTGDAAPADHDIPPLEGMSKSTFTQSVINSVNLLVGLSLLSLPYTLKTGGWIMGIGCILAGGFTTLFTSFLLIKCMQLDPEIRTLGDIGQLAFGARGRWLVSSVYVFELMSCGISYVIVVGDTLKALWPALQLSHLKVVAAAVMIASSWVDSLAVLSISSSLGILASVSLLFITLYDGISAAHAPGSLWEPAATQLWPQDWSFLLLNMGIRIEPGLVIFTYSGHSVIPSIYTDMRSPRQFRAMISLSYMIAIFVWFVSVSTAVYLMFGADIEEEFTLNLYTAPGYSKPLNSMLLWILIIVPTCKYALLMNPVAHVFERMIQQAAQAAASRVDGSAGIPHTDAHITATTTHEISQGANASARRTPHNVPAPIALRVAVRTALGILVLFVSTCFPNFTHLISLVGALFSFFITLVFPCACHLVLFLPTLAWWEVAVDVLLVSLGLAGDTSVTGQIARAAVNWMCEFISCVAGLAATLTNLMRKRAKWKQTHVCTHASKQGLCDWIGQCHDDNQIHPVLYWSRKLHDPEIANAPFNLEFMALVEMLDNHRDLLELLTFSVWADHKSLAMIEESLKDSILTNGLWSVQTLKLARPEKHRVDLDVLLPLPYPAA
ncbi:hypothetical protein HK105_200166 [Polyrhizophydium stewartii]|uniref:Amino acid transporter transmembrane domain-containing protein n=1 Tax=Polyrhizophydium stewartii TaxID=2732419 RepID=A0ABR4NKU0_9FUNG